MIEKQQLCNKLEQELQQLKGRLTGLLRKEEDAQSVFDAELQRRHQHMQSCERSYRYNSSVVTDARGRYYSMSSDNWSSCEGQALQEASQQVESMRGNIATVEQRLKEAKRPPPALYQPLPDSRESDYNALAVLFYAKSDLTGSLPLLQQFW